MVSKRERWTVDIPAALQEWVTYRCVSAHQRIVQTLILGMMLNIVLLLLVFHGQVASFPLYAISGGLALTCAHRYWIGQKIKKNKRRIFAQEEMNAFEYNSYASASLIGCMMMWLMPIATDFQLVFLSIMGTTLIASAGFTKRTMPYAAVASITIICFSMISGLAATNRIEAIAASALVLSSSVLMARMSLMAYRLFVIRILKEHDAHASSETVKMLLNDYQDQGSDWLFELDQHGHMMNVSARFASAAGLNAEDMNGRALVSIFEKSEALDILKGHIEERRAFRSLTVTVPGQNAMDTKYWSINGRPSSGGVTSTVRFRGVISDISAEKQAVERVRHMAHYDSLTDLPNRLMFNGALNRAFTGNGRDKNNIALIYLDVDHFKTVNDMYGHASGDAFLQSIAARLNQTVEESRLGGEYRMVARLGGDEFAIMLIGDDIGDKVVRLSDLLVDALNKPYFVNGHEINSSISMGLALAPEHATTAQVLQTYADIALYVAKDEGRNRWEMFAPGMDVAIQQRHSIERDLRTALTEDQLRLYLQPLVDVETGRETGFEALVRWEHPEKGLVMPNDFIPIAEETGLIVPIGEWVLRTAMAEAATWDNSASIAVNISPVQLRSPNLLPVVINSLAETGLDPARLELEITETVLMQDCEANIAVLNKLHDLGVKIALDDFGTGYASLNYLRTFPFDKIKIDRSFVTDLETREDCRAIVGAVISLANKLGMCTLAEGVEHEAQLINLREQGCEMVQGWLFGKAMPAEHYALRKGPRQVTQSKAA
jgi:diguanylate cyclase (GGDEF)-like protein/PAS domain S-box-containing protein